MAKILLVEDDPVLGKSLSLNLELAANKVVWVQTLQDARYRNDNFEFDLILLDLNLPDGSGFSLCSEVRESGSRIPIIMLTAKTDEESVVNGLTYGANDYVRKPFSGRELLARIKAALHEPVVRENQVRVGPVLMLFDQRRVIIDNKEIDFNRREFDIFAYFLKNASTVISRESIVSALNTGGELLDRTVDSHLSHIRAKLRKHEVSQVAIVSVYGVGYKMEMQ